MNVIVCIPAFNEEKNIAKVILGVEKYADKIIVCDDGSSDMTYKIAKKLGVEVIKHNSNLGKGAAIRSLVKQSLTSIFDILITIDGDCQFDSNDIPLLIEPIKNKKADVVIGERHMNKKNVPLHRIMGNKLLSSMTNMKSGLHINDTQSGFRAYSIHSLKNLNFDESGMSIESQTIIDIIKNNLNIIEVPISVNYSGVKVKRNPLVHLTEVLDYIITRTIVESPLMYLGIPGILFIIFGLIAGVRVLNIFYEIGALAIGTALVAVTLLIFGLVLFVTSLLVKLLRSSVNTK